MNLCLDRDLFVRKFFRGDFLIWWEISYTYWKLEEVMKMLKVVLYEVKMFHRWNEQVL